MIKFIILVLVVVNCEDACDQSSNCHPVFHGTVISQPQMSHDWMDGDRCFDQVKLDDDRIILVKYPFETCSTLTVGESVVVREFLAEGWVIVK